MREMIVCSDCYAKVNLLRWTLLVVSLSFMLLVVDVKYIAAQTNSACGGSANNPCACSERFICDGNGNCGCQQDQFCADTNCGNQDVNSLDRRLRSLGRTRGGDFLYPLMQGDPSTPAKDDGKRTALPILDGKVHLTQSVRTCERDLSSDNTITVVTMGRTNPTENYSIFTRRYTAFVSDPIHKAWLASVPNQDCQHSLKQATNPTTAPTRSRDSTTPNTSSTSTPKSRPSFSCIVAERPIVTTRADGAVQKMTYPLKNSCSVCALVRWDFFQDGETMYPLGGANSTIVKPNSTQNATIYPTKFLGSKNFKVTGVDVCP